MRKFFALFLTALLSTICLAETRTVNEAQAIASSFGQTVYAGTRTSIAEPTLAVTSKSEFGKDLYYVFNFAETGFVVVSADDRATTILAYSDCESFAEENLSDGARWIFEYYQKELDLLSNNQTHAKTNVVTRTTNAINPLLGDIRFGQLSPYNNLCPIDGGHRSVTGCVATAVASIMAYHKYPEIGEGKKEYQWMKNELTLSYDFDTNPFDWENILPSYNGKETEEQKNAIANLMLACAIGLESNFSSSETGVSPVTIMPLFADYLKYDKAISTKEREYFTSSEWEGLIDNELENNRPVLYIGYTIGIPGQRTGHAFVLDGRDEQGLYHINWGWDGNSNGYFSLDPVSGLSPLTQGTGGGNGGFCQSQMIFTGIQPDKGGEKTAELFVYSMSIDDEGLGYIYVNYGLEPFKGEVGLGVFNKSDELIDVKNITSFAEEPLESLIGWEQVDNAEDYQFNDVLLYPVMRNSDSEDFRPIPCSLACASGIFVQEIDGAYSYSTNTYNLSGLVLENIELIGEAHDNETAQFAITIKNTNDRDIYGYISLYIENTSNNKVQELYDQYMLEIAIKAGESYNFIFETIVPLAVGDGSCSVSVMICDKGNGVYPITGGDKSLTIDVLPDKNSGIEEINFDGLNGFVNIYSINGILVASGKQIPYGDSNFDITTIPTGIYVIKIFDGEEVVDGGKFIKYDK